MFRDRFRGKALILALLSLSALLALMPGTGSVADPVTVAATCPQDVTGHRHSVYVSSYTYKDSATDETALTLIPKGDRVAWFFIGGIHSVTHGFPNQGSLLPRDFDSGLVNPNPIDPPCFEVTFDAPGVYPYFCRAHPQQMRGEVVVH